MQHPSDRLVEEFKVVADHEQTTAIVAQEIEQPRLGIDVEVVRRFIQKQRVASSEQNACELDTSTLTTRQHVQWE